MEVDEHGHMLKLIDLHLQYPHCEEEEEEEEEEEDSGGGDLTTKEGFRGACYRCGQEINMYHRYYYKCMEDSSCDFSIHKFCAELSSTLEHPSHPHPLKLIEGYWWQYMQTSWRCNLCQSQIKPREMLYTCMSCDFFIDLNCVIEVGKKIIHHPCHPHVLMCAISKPILCECNACGKEHKGIFYQCTTCSDFTIHNDCAFLPKTLLIQQTTNEAFYHTHPLTISYSFPREDQSAKHYPRCRVCGHDFIDWENLWIYKCDKCLYYVHVDCATSRREPFMSIFLPDGKLIKNFEDADHPHLLHLPFHDETYSIPKHLFFHEIGLGTIRSDKVNLKHISHDHPLILVDNMSTINSSSLMCHNPMKKIQLLCNGCLRPIMETMPFYKCVEHCHFALHEWCTRLPAEIENHPFHPEHTLVLMHPDVLPFFFGVFYCDVCHLPCNGFTYCCVKCGYYVDLTCGFIPQKITHKAHPNHLLSIVRTNLVDKHCHMCLQDITWNPYAHQFYDAFGCNMCDVYMHPVCALLLPETIKHKHDKHPMHLSYLPIENHKSEYFCEICEEDLNPHESFYHCQGCVQSIHTACASLILKCENDTYIHYKIGIHHFVNVKFGGIHKTGGHPHPLSFAQGIVSDGECSICSRRLQYKMIFKCLECKFAIDYHCSRFFN